MDAPSARDLEARLQRIEQQLRDLRSRLTAIERALNPQGEHPVDRSVVREKVVYDWQS